LRSNRRTKQSEGQVFSATHPAIRHAKLLISYAPIDPETRYPGPLISSFPDPYHPIPSSPYLPISSLLRLGENTQGCGILR